MTILRGTWTRLALVGLATVLLAGCLLIPDDKEKGTQVANMRPSVRITGGAMTPDPGGVDYRVQFFWSGSDVDGSIELYQWAVDDTISERAWRDTVGFNARFNFGAATQRPGSDSLFTDWHTFYIRAVDNEAGVSAPDRRLFNARTIAPETRITFPDLRVLSRPVQLQRTFVIQWVGEDIDSSQPEQTPVYYEYKLAKLGDPLSPDEVMRQVLRNGDNELDTLGVGSKKKWIRVPEGIRTITLRDLPIGESFVFGVRAIDEAGAVEPLLESSRNMLGFAVTPEASQPFVTVNEPKLGSYRFPGNTGDTWELDVPSGQSIRFSWTGDAAYYGSQPGNVNYALDIPDPDDESLRDPQGRGGWVGWGKWKALQFPITFTPEDAGTTHFFYILMRDVSDNRTSTRRCIIKMRVIAFTFSKFALVVDDAIYQTSNPSDAQHDDFIENALLRRLHDYGTVDRYNHYTRQPNGAETGSPRVMALTDVADYQHICYSVQRGSNANTGLGRRDQSGSTNTTLTAFLGAGGRLFLFGGQLAASNRVNFQHPFEPPDETDLTGRNYIYYRFMYMRNLVVSSTAQQGGTCYEPTSGIVGARSMHPSYPDLQLDLRKWNPEEIVGGKYLGGIGSWEGHQFGLNQELLRFEGLDSLYAAETWDRAIAGCEDVISPSRGAIVAMRYQSTAADTIAGTQHGRVIWYNFQPYWFDAQRMMDAGTAAVNWMVTGRDQ